VGYRVVYIDCYFFDGVSIWKMSRVILALYIGESSVFFLSFLAIMSFLGKKAVFNRFNHEDSQLPSRSQTRVFSASTEGVRNKTEVKQESINIMTDNALKKENCMLRLLGNETILVLQTQVDIKSLRKILEWAKKNVDMNEVWDYLVNNTNEKFLGRLRCRKKYYIPYKMVLKIKKMTVFSDKTRY
jgi:hypothetical protein